MIHTTGRYEANDLQAWRKDLQLDAPTWLFRVLLDAMGPFWGY